MRYKIYEGSESGHCCFKYTVLDTKNIKNGYYYNVCEVLNKQQAMALCKALNHLYDCGEFYEIINTYHVHDLISANEGEIKS